MSMAFDLSRVDAAQEGLRAADSRIGAIVLRLLHRSALPANKPAAWWVRPGGLALDAVHNDSLAREFVVRFEQGTVYRLPWSKVSRKTPIAVDLDSFRHGVEVVFADGSFTTFAGDHVLYECEPRYRAGEPSPRSTPVGRRIRALRERAGIPSASVAAQLSMARSNYSRLESGRHTPNLKVLLRIAEILGVPLQELIGADTG